MTLWRDTSLDGPPIFNGKEIRFIGDKQEKKIKMVKRKKNKKEGGNKGENKEENIGIAILEKTWTIKSNLLQLIFIC